jgi:hypothetical protein
MSARSITPMKPFTAVASDRIAKTHVADEPECLLMVGLAGIIVILAALRRRKREQANPKA